MLPPLGKSIFLLLRKTDFLLAPFSSCKSSHTHECRFSIEFTMVLTRKPLVTYFPLVLSFSRNLKSFLPEAPG